MPRSSTRHSREVQGIDSAGERPDDHGDMWNGPRPIPPTYSNLSDPVNVALTEDLSTGWQYPVAGAYTVDQLPTGLTMDANGQVTGTPTVQPETVAATVYNDGVPAPSFDWTITL